MHCMRAGCPPLRVIHYLGDHRTRLPVGGALGSCPIQHGMEQPTAGVAVPAKDERAANSRREQQVQSRCRTAAAWSRAHYQSVHRRRRQPPAMALGDYVCRDGKRVVVVPLEIARCDVWRSADPGPCRAKQRVAFLDRLGDQTVEPPQAASP